MKKKNIIIITSVSIIVLCLGLTLIFNHHNNVKKKEKEQNLGDVLFNIKSTKKNPIKQGDIEVVNIDVVQKDQQVKVVFTIKNTSNEKVEGTFICFELLDENREYVTTVAANIQDPLSAKKTGTYEVAIDELEEDVVIKYAEIEGMSHQTKESVEEELEEKKNSIYG